MTKSRLALFSYIFIILFFMSAMLIEHLYFKHAIVIAFILMVLPIVAIQLYRFYKSANEDHNAHVPKDEILDLYSVIIGAIVTYLLVERFGLSPVVASSTVGVIIAIVYKRVAVAIFCGTFVGMTSPSLFSLLEIAIASTIAGLLFVKGKPYFSGIGGKLGTTAFFGNMVYLLLKSPANYHIMNINIDITHRIFDVSGLFSYMIWGAFASFATYYFSVKWLNNIVLSSSLVGLIPGVLLPIWMPREGYVLAIAIYCASFAGMSAVTRFTKPIQYLIAGAISGAIFFNTLPIFVGVGGKLGTIGFIASLFTLALFKKK